MQTADEVGFDSIWVMDHFFQIRSVGPSEEPMLEGFTALGYMAAMTQRARLGLMVGGIHYRQPGLWLKAATTLDVLSGGRSWFGIGAAWNQEESDGPGLPLPRAPRPVPQLEDTLRFVHEGWSGERGTEARFEGTTVQRRAGPQLAAGAQPAAPSDPGRRRRRAARRCGWWLATRTPATSSATRTTCGTSTRSSQEHCVDVGRDYDEIEKTNLTGLASRPTARTAR